MRSKEEQDFRYIYDKYRGIVMLTCLDILLNEQDAEDATQEVFIKYMVSPPKNCDKDKLSSWFRLVSKNHCIDILRRSKEVYTYIDNYHASGDNSYELLIDLDSEFIADSVREGISNKLQQDVLSMRARGVAYEDISSTLGRNINTCRVTFIKTKAKIKINLKNIGYNL